jgi:hypothetical protein
VVSFVGDDEPRRVRFIQPPCKRVDRAQLDRSEAVDRIARRHEPVRDPGFGEFHARLVEQFAAMDDEPRLDVALRSAAEHLSRKHGLARAGRLLEQNTPGAGTKAGADPL